MSFFDYFRKRPKSASLAKDRLSIIVARERASTRGGADFLPQLQQELLAVIARYVQIDLANVVVNLDRHEGSEVLELNITLPEGQPPAPGAPRPSFA
jgi:cell division topological specificity factor